MSVLGILSLQGQQKAWAVKVWGSQPKREHYSRGFIVLSAVSVSAALLPTATLMATVCKMIQPLGDTRPLPGLEKSFSGLADPLVGHHRGIRTDTQGLSWVMISSVVAIGSLTAWVTEKFKKKATGLGFFFFPLVLSFVTVAFSIFFARSLFNVDYWIWQPAPVDIGELEQTDNHITLLFWCDWKVFDVVEIFSFSSVRFLLESYTKSPIDRKGKRGKVHGFQISDIIGLLSLFSSLDKKCHTGSELEYIYRSPWIWCKTGKADQVPVQELCQPGSAGQYPK